MPRPPLRIPSISSIFLLIILAIASLLRFYHYGSFSYSNDELSALYRLHYDTFGELVQKGFYVDGHPGGVQVFLWQWVRHFGDSEWAVRLPFVVMGILAVWMAYKVAKFMFGTVAGLFSAAALAFLQFPLLYSQIARPYGPGVLFALMLIYFWLRIFFTEDGKLNAEKPRWAHLIGFTLSASLCMYNHYFSFLFALIVGFSGFVVARRNNVMHYIGAAVVAALLFVPHIHITLNHLTFKGLGLWLGTPGKGWIVGHIFYIFDQSVFVLTITVLTMLALFVMNKNQAVNLRFRLFLASWFLLPVLIGYVYSIKVNPVLQHPVLIFSFPCFVILLFSHAGNVLDKSKAILLTMFLAAGVLGTTVVNAYYSRQHFGEFKDIALLSAKWQQQYGDTCITKVISINNPQYIEHYLKPTGQSVKFSLYNVEGLEGLKALGDIVQHSRTPFFEYAVTKPAPIEAENIIRSVYPYVVELHDYDGLSSVALYGRAKGEDYVHVMHLSEVKMLQASLQTDSLVPDGSPASAKAYKMDAAAEYSPGIELNMDELQTKKELTLIAEADVFSVEGSGGDVLVVSLETAEGKSLEWRGTSTSYVETPGKWCHVVNTLKLADAIPKGAKMKVYFWNKDKRQVFLKGLKCGVYQ